MRRRIFGKLNMLAFVTGGITAVLNLLGAADVSWWVVGGLMVGPLALLILIIALGFPIVVVASAIDENPDSHKQEEE